MGHRSGPHDRGEINPQLEILNYDRDIYAPVQLQENGTSCSRPEIVDFKVFVGDSMPQLDPRMPRGSPKTPQEALVLSYYINNRELSQSDSGITGGPFPFYFFDSGPPGLLLQQDQQNSLSLCSSGGKKSVSFEQGTIFIERDMNSPFWQDFQERRLRRKLIKQRRRMMNQGRTLTLFDLVRMIFSKKSRSGRHHNSDNVILEKFQEMNSISAQEPCQLAEEATVLNNSPSTTPEGGDTLEIPFGKEESNSDEIDSPPIYLNNNVQFPKFQDEDINLSDDDFTSPTPNQMKSESKVQKIVHSVRYWWLKKTKLRETERN